MQEKRRSNSKQESFFRSFLLRAGFSGSLLFTLGCVYLLYVLEQIPRIQPAGQLSVLVWPRFMLIALIVISVGNAIRTAVTCVREKRCPPEGVSSLLDKELDGVKGFGVLEGFIEEEIKEASAVKEEASPDEVKLKRNFKVVIGITLISCLYIYLMNLMGFAIANALFMVSFLLFTRERKPLRLVLLPLISTVIFLYLFGKVVYISLPLGKGVFNAFTIGLYRVLRIF